MGINEKRDDLDKWTYISALGKKVEELEQRIDQLNFIVRELKDNMVLEFERKK
jgi:hypothetical protein